MSLRILANRNNCNADLPPMISESSVSNTFNKTKKTSFSNKSQQCIVDPHKRKSSRRKSKQKRRIIDDNSISLKLATSLHSNVPFNNEDYFLTKYIHQLFTDKYHLR